jgi:hypothetical protein
MKKVLHPSVHVTLVCLALVLSSFTAIRIARGYWFDERSPLQTTILTEATRCGASVDAAQALAKAVVAMVTEQAKLSPSDGAVGDQFGLSVSLFGNRALVGARLTDDNGTDSGSAYVFVFNGTSWSEEAKLLPSDGAAGDFFGTAVSLSASRALVGAPFKAGTGIHTGAAYIFVFDGTSWTQEAKLNGSDSGDIDNFGDSVSLLSNRALVSAPFNGNGAAYYFVLSSGVWTQQAKLLPDGGAGFIDAVLLSGNRALLGGRGLTPANVSYIFVYDGVSWSQEARLTSGVAYDQFGISVSLSGTRAIIGAPLDGDNGVNSGAAYIFTFDGTTWSEQAKLTASDEARNNQFGTSVSLSGTRALVGAIRGTGSIQASGAAYLFAFDGANWTQRNKFIASDGDSYDTFGDSVSLSGARALVGASTNTVNGVASGSAYVFGR